MELLFCEHRQFFRPQLVALHPSNRGQVICLCTVQWDQITNTRWARFAILSSVSLRNMPVQSMRRHKAAHLQANLLSPGRNSAWQAHAKPYSLASAKAHCHANLSELKVRVQFVWINCAPVTVLLFELVCLAPSSLRCMLHYFLLVKYC
jgi:hypothetical protein